jgi:16S rRNA (adenine1518-N6/adenine1519-N6)-dimethyltransferase
MENEEKYFDQIKEYKLLAKHEVGQNFLVDSSTCSKIVNLAELSSKDRVLEIGSGAGSLSYFIAERPAKADLIDIDEALVTKLQHDFAGRSNVHPQMGNIMRFDLRLYNKIIGNLPYYITSGIVEKVLLEAPHLEKAVLMVQKEVLTRLLAKKGEDYGPLPILLAYRATAKKAFLVPRTSFSPAPHVDSVVFVLDFRPSSDSKTAQKLYTLVSSLFLHRRKTILNNLVAYLGDSGRAAAALKKASINPQKRPEELSLQEYLELLSQLH